MLIQAVFVKIPVPPFFSHGIQLFLRTVTEQIVLHHHDFGKRGELGSSGLGNTVETGMRLFGPGTGCEAKRTNRAPGRKILITPPRPLEDGERIRVFCRK